MIQQSESFLVTQYPRWAVLIFFLQINHTSLLLNIVLPLSKEDYMIIL